MLVNFAVYVVLALKYLLLRKKSVVDDHLALRATSKACLDKDILEIAIIARADYRAEEINFRNKAAYYQFCLWRYGKRGKGNRRVLLSCVVKLIRTRYPKPKGTYMGFRSS